MRSYGREYVVGLVFFLLLGSLGVITFVLGRDVFKSSEQVTFRFDDVAGLTKGSDVWINGLPSGTIKDISITREGIVAATASLHNKLEDLDLGKGVSVEVKDKSTLGGSVIAITTLRSAVAGAPKSLEEIQSRTWSAKAGASASGGGGPVEKPGQAAGEKPVFVGKARLGDQGVKALDEGPPELRTPINARREWLASAEGGFLLGGLHELLHGARA